MPYIACPRCRTRVYASTAGGEPCPVCQSPLPRRAMAESAEEPAAPADDVEREAA